MLLGHSAKSWGQLPDWKRLFYYVSYEQEFVSRGLPGEVLRLVFGGPSEGTILVVAWVAALAALGGALAYLIVATRGGDAGATFWWRLTWALPIAVGSAGAWQIGFDLGRYDHWSLAIFFCGLLLLRRGGSAALLTAPLAVIALLTHEAFLLLHLPLWIAAWLARPELPGDDRPAMERQRIAVVAALLGASLLTFAALRQWGDVEPDTRQRLIETAIASGLESSQVHQAVQVLASSSVDNLHRALSHGSERAKSEWGIMAAIFVVLAGLLWTAYRSGHRSWPRLLLAIAPASILPLYALGIDYARWTAHLYGAAWAAALWLSGSSPPHSIRIWLLALAVTGFLGPIGIVTFFPASGRFLY